MKSEKVKIKILPLWVTGQKSRKSEPFAAHWLRALPENKWQFPSLIVTEQKSKFTESARNELAAGPACPLKSAQTRLHSVTEQKSEFTESGRNELAAGPACPMKFAQTKLHSVTEQKSEFIEGARNELAPGTARPAGDSLHFLPGGKKIKVLPPSSRRQAAVHRTAAFRWFESPLTHAKRQPPRLGWLSFW